MQTKLRVLGLVFVAGLLWMSPMFAANQGSWKAGSQKAAKARPYNGVASWYGKKHQGRKMANGERFDRHKLTAACWFLPLGTVIRVVNLDNGKDVNVTIADRGPNHRLHRLIDLSEAAAAQLDFIGNGLTTVFLAPVALPTPEAVDMSGQVIAPLFDAPSREETAFNLLPDATLR